MPHPSSLYPPAPTDASDTIGTIVGGLHASAYQRAPGATREILELSLLPRFLRGIVALLFIFLLTITAICIWVPWQQTAPGYGRVIAFTPLERQQVIEAPVKGRVDEWLIREGERVDAGQPLVRLADNDPQYLERLQAEELTLIEQRDAAARKVTAYQAKLDNVFAAREREIATVEAKIRQHEDKILYEQQSIQAERASLRTDELNLKRIQELRKEGLVSVRDEELALLKVETSRTKLESARAMLRIGQSALAAERAYLEKVRNDTAAKIAEAEAQLQDATSSEAKSRAELLKVRVRLTRQQAQVVSAPRAGTVLRLLAADNAQQIKEGDPLLVLVPDTDNRAVELWVSGMDMPLIQPNSKVRLQFEGWPALQFSGWPSVAVGTFGGIVAFVDALDDGKGSFRIVISPDPQDDPWPDAQYLRQGVKAQGWVILSEVSVGYEIWRQINGFPASVPTPPDTSPEKPKKKDKGGSDGDGAK
jgi:multidrug efflux pump subunit AcrA (membrane-fusion protein)